jgi:hypothetical protein
MDPGDCFKIAFQTHVVHYEFRVMSFGLTCAPHTFQRVMNSSLAPLLKKCVLVFFDDILIYSPTYEYHLVHMQQVFQLLQDQQWKVKLSKCSFAKREISYLGYVISEKGVSTSLAKVTTVANWPTQTIKELRIFLGLAGYYRKFVQHFGIICRPLTDLLKKNIAFVWTSDHELAFKTIKQAFVQAPVLAMPNFAKPFYVEIDASDVGVGAVFMQDNHPCPYISKSLGPRMRGLSTHEKEYVAILLVVEQWRSYL